MIPVAAYAPIIINTMAGPKASAGRAHHLQRTGSGNESVEVAGSVNPIRNGDSVGV